MFPENIQDTSAHFEFYLAQFSSHLPFCALAMLYKEHWKEPFWKLLNVMHWFSLATQTYRAVILFRGIEQAVYITHGFCAMWIFEKHSPAVDKYLLTCFSPNKW